MKIPQSSLWDFFCGIDFIRFRGITIKIVIVCRMKIAQIPPLYESVPPQKYGGTERVVSYLVEELVRQGHEVTLFGTGDSITKATLYEICDRATRLNEQCIDPYTYHILQLQELYEHSGEFDIIHFHNDYLHFPLSGLGKYAHITTLHGRMDLPELKRLYTKFGQMPVVSISNDQRRPLPFANWVDTIYHGLPAELYQQGSGDGGYLAFLGRISPEKRPDRAIEIAKQSGVPLKIAAKVDRVDLDYYNDYIKPMMDHPLIEFIGEIGDAEKGKFLGDAAALLFPIDWPEPFGMVLIEAMACGTPVIAFPLGSVPEIIKDGRNGYVVDNVEDAVTAVSKLPLISRHGCRALFEGCFTAERMAKDYVRIYEMISEQHALKKVFDLSVKPAAIA